MALKKGIIFSIILLLTACSNGKITETQEQPSSKQSESSIELPSHKSVKIDKNIEASIPAKDDFDFQDGDKNVLSMIEASISYTQEKDVLLFVFQITNNAKHPFTFHFDTTQQYTFTIRKADGEVVKELKMTTNKKLPSTLFLKPGGTVVYDVSVKKLPHGSYTINFVFPSKELTLKKSIDFSIEE